MEKFNKSNLQSPSTYFKEQGLKLSGGGEWRSSICPFHQDTHPSLRINIDTGSFKCMACGKRGGDVISFHMQRYGMGFVETVKQLGAWRYV